MNEIGQEIKVVFDDELLHVRLLVLLSLSQSFRILAFVLTVNLIQLKLVAESGLTESLDVILVEFKSENHFLLEGLLELRVLSDLWTCVDQVKETWKTHIVPVDVRDK